MFNKDGAGKVLLLAAGIGVGLGAREYWKRSREADLRGQVVLITGGSRGLGLQLAREFAGHGCRLVLCARNEAGLDRARSAIERDYGAQVLALPCDVTQPDDVERLVRAAESHFGRIDVLVNNAGAIQVGPVQNMNLDDFETAMNVMFWGVLYPTMAVLPGMIERRAGRIVNITSIGGKISFPHLIPYNCAKFAAVALSEGLRAELGGAGIHVLTVVPGLMRTGSYLNAFFKGQQENEFRWFGPSASLPGISMNAERAARQIVRAARRAEPEAILSLPAKLIAKLHGIAPGLTQDLFGIVNRVILPGPSTGGETQVRGKEMQRKVNSRLFNTVTALGRSAAGQLNQYS